MPRPLPKASDELNVVSRDVWDAMRDRLGKADKFRAQPPIDMIDAPGGRTFGFKPAPDHRPGVIVCAPAGQQELPLPMAWVSLARIANTQYEPPTALVRFEPWPPGSDFALTVPAVNLGAYHCDDPEQFKPGTPVVLEWGLDQGNPPTRRYYFRTAERAKCLPPCADRGSSSSGSGSSGACPCYEVVYYAGEGADASVLLNATGPDGFYSGPNGSGIEPSNGNWELTLPDGTVYVSPIGGSCPPAGADAWQLKDPGSGNNTPLVAIEPCAEGSSSGSESSESSVGCVEVIKAGTLSFTFDPETCTIAPSYETVYVHDCPDVPGRTFVNGAPTE